VKFHRKTLLIKRFAHRHFFLVSVVCLSNISVRKRELSMLIKQRQLVFFLIKTVHGVTPLLFEKICHASLASRLLYKSVSKITHTIFMRYVECLLILSSDILSILQRVRLCHIFLGMPGLDGKFTFLCFDYFFWVWRYYNFYSRALTTHSDAQKAILTDESRSVEKRFIFLHI